MRFHAVLASALCSSASLFGHVRADELDDLAADSSTTSVAQSSTSTASIDRPTFTPTTLKAPFLEQFTDDWDSRWSPSHAKKEQDKTSEKSDEEWAYVGEWAVEEPHTLKGIAGDKGLVVKQKAAHHAISAKFPRTIDNTGKTLVVQYEVKLQNGLECGGAYLKLLKDSKALHAEEFSNASPYVIMFGPDKCGATNKVHFIFKHQNPKTGDYEEKHVKSPPMARISKLTALYTLIVKPDQTFEMKIDGASVKNGTLLDDFMPAVNPPPQIDDLEDKKPEDWVDQAKIADPSAKKPKDWDEDAPYEVVDEEATKPSNWLDDEPTVIPDPEAQKPEDWDDEEDGDWVPPTVPNPKCEDGAGCGEWKPPMTRNPAYKGKWTAALIDNPAFKGAWAPRKIANPAYFEDKTPADFEPMGAIGFEIWTMQNDILFDNIYIGHSIEDAEALKAQTFDIKHPIEKKEEASSMPEPAKDKASSPMDLKFRDDPLHYVREKFDLFVTIARTNPWQAVRFVPEIAAGLAAIALAVIATLVGVLSMGGASTPAVTPAVKVPVSVKQAAEKDKEVAVEATDQIFDGATTGAEKVQAEVQRRTTRSSAVVVEKNERI
ncbi:MAG: hypothetical protein M1826_000685 [Phylliscum demangeonii]|nr:MAG: hypothetical protein M1826_000685 [Phylliscum demangeonii]